MNTNEVDYLLDQAFFPKSFPTSKMSFGGETGHRWTNLISNMSTSHWGRTSIRLKTQVQFQKGFHIYNEEFVKMVTSTG